jgi:hypothetical protein
MACRVASDEKHGPDRVDVAGADVRQTAACRRGGPLGRRGPGQRTHQRSDGEHRGAAEQSASVHVRTSQGSDGGDRVHPAGDLESGSFRQ